MGWTTQEKTYSDITIRRSEAPMKGPLPPWTRQPCGLGFELLQTPTQEKTYNDVTIRRSEAPTKGPLQHWRRQP